jgi:CRP/FNR family transcriptional regulator, cyclic AMP receptor protein
LGLDPSRLKRIPLFEKFSEDELRQIAPFAEEKSVEEGVVLVREGDYSYQFVAIEEGTTKVTRGGETLAELGPGDFFGEIGLLEKSLRTATVEATSPMRLITLTGWDMARVEKAMPEAIEELHRAIEERRPPGDGGG